ncbi:MAG: hypothetical protein ACHQ1H_12755 [Nitrososphaerales archaeon]
MPKRFRVTISAIDDEDNDAKYDHIVYWTPKYTPFDPSSASAWNQLRGIIQRVANDILNDLEIEQKKNSFKNQVLE